MTWASLTQQMWDETPLCLGHESLIYKIRHTPMDFLKSYLGTRSTNSTYLGMRLKSRQMLDLWIIDCLQVLIDDLLGLWSTPDERISKSDVRPDRLGYVNGRGSSRKVRGLAPVNLLHYLIWQIAQLRIHQEEYLSVLSVQLKIQSWLISKQSFWHGDTIRGDGMSSPCLKFIIYWPTFIMLRCKTYMMLCRPAMSGTLANLHAGLTDVRFNIHYVTLRSYTFIV